MFNYQVLKRFRNIHSFFEVYQKHPERFAYLKAAYIYKTSSLTTSAVTVTIDSKLSGWRGVAR